MESGGGFKPAPLSLALGQHRTTSHSTARQATMRSCSTAFREAADETVSMNTRRAHKLQRIMLDLMLPARATRELSLHRILRSGNPARPPQLARTITGPGSNGFELLGEDADQRGAWWVQGDARWPRSGCEEAATPRRSLPTCRSELAQQIRDGCQFLAEEELQLEAAAARLSPCQFRLGSSSSAIEPRSSAIVKRPTRNCAVHQKSEGSYVVLISPLPLH